MRRDLFDHPVPEWNAGDAFARRTDPETSHEAAARADVAGADVAILSALTTYGGGTTEEIACWTGKALVSVSPRMIKLERKGLVVRSGRKKNKSGSTAIVWAKKGGDA